MLLSRLRPSKKKNAETAEQKVTRQPRLPELDEYLLKRDYAGAISMLEFKVKSANRDESTELWLGHCYFRAGEFKKACEVYERMLKLESCPNEVYVYLGCCFLFLGMYKEAKETAEKCKRSPLQNRLMFHVSHKLGDEKKLMLHHQQLGEVLEDQLSLASIHYMRQHYAEAIEIYKSILTQNTNMIAVNVYMAMCYYKMDYYDVAMEMLAVYLKSFPDSPAALNLKACITYKTYMGKAALAEVDQIQKGTLYPAIRELLNHNMVVFKEGDGALQVFPGMVNDVPEARLNLIIYNLRIEDIGTALNLCQELEPQRPLEFLIKAIVFTFWGNNRESKDHLKTAEQFFKMVGESLLEADTIIGRQAMASSYFLQQKFDDVKVYLHSVKAYHVNDDTFHWNYGQALLACRNYKEAEEELLAVTSSIRDASLYKYFLARAFIMNGKPQFAWDLYTRTKDNKVSFTLLRIIAHDCYKAEEYYFAAKGFDGLEKIDPSPEHWQGKMCSVAGVFKLLIAGKASNEQMSEVLIFLERGGQPQSDSLANTIRGWARRNQINLS
ncbi:unnamed protein product [Auanema sp. JU1783]|nr:unnamed protein product [Auanema sp. JU1783]